MVEVTARKKEFEDGNVGYVPTTCPARKEDKALLVDDIAYCMYVNGWMMSGKVHTCRHTVGRLEHMVDEPEEMIHNCNL